MTGGYFYPCKLPVCTICSLFVDLIVVKSSFSITGWLFTLTCFTTSASFGPGRPRLARVSLDSEEMTQQVNEDYSAASSERKPKTRKRLLWGIGTCCPTKQRPVQTHSRTKTTKSIAIENLQDFESALTDQRKMQRSSIGETFLDRTSVSNHLWSSRWSPVCTFPPGCP